MEIAFRPVPSISSLLLHPFILPLPVTRDEVSDRFRNEGARLSFLGSIPRLPVTFWTGATVPKTVGGSGNEWTRKICPLRGK